MAAERFPLNLGAAPQLLSIKGAEPGLHQLVLSYGINPSGGTVSVEHRLVGDDQWRPVEYATDIPATNDVALLVYGSIAQLRVTFSGIVGGANAELWRALIPAEGFPPGAFTGQRALTVQPYTEANVKNGLEYYVRAVWNAADPILPGTTRKLFFQTGVKPVIVKLRDFHYVAEQMTLRLYAGPTGVTGGTALEIHNYNSINPVPTTIVAAMKNVATVSDGVEFDGGDPEHMFGAGATGQRSQISIPEGRERIVPPNSTFIVAISNTGTGNALAQYFLDWYEGTPDLPIP